MENNLNETIYEGSMSGPPNLSDPIACLAAENTRPLMNSMGGVACSHKLHDVGLEKQTIIT